MEGPAEDTQPSTSAAGAVARSGEQSGRPRGWVAIGPKEEPGATGEGPGSEGVTVARARLHRQAQE